MGVGGKPPNPSGPQSSPLSFREETNSSLVAQSSSSSSSSPLVASSSLSENRKGSGRRSPHAAIPQSQALSQQQQQQEAGHFPLRLRFRMSTLTPIDSPSQDSFLFDDGSTHDTLVKTLATDTKHTNRQPSQSLSSSSSPSGGGVGNTTMANTTASGTATIGPPASKITSIPLLSDTGNKNVIKSSSLSSSLTSSPAAIGNSNNNSSRLDQKKKKRRGIRIRMVDSGSSSSSEDDEKAMSAVTTTTLPPVNDNNNNKKDGQKERDLICLETSLSTDNNNENSNTTTTPTAREKTDKNDAHNKTLSSSSSLPPPLSQLSASVSSKGNENKQNAAVKGVDSHSELVLPLSSSSASLPATQILNDEIKKQTMTVASLSSSTTTTTPPILETAVSDKLRASNNNNSSEKAAVCMTKAITEGGGPNNHHHNIDGNHSTATTTSCTTTCTTSSGDIDGEPLDSDSTNDNDDNHIHHNDDNNVIDDRGVFPAADTTLKVDGDRDGDDDAFVEDHNNNNHDDDGDDDDDDNDIDIDGEPLDSSDSSTSGANEDDEQGTTKRERDTAATAITATTDITAAVTNDNDNDDNRNKDGTKKRRKKIGRKDNSNSFRVLTLSTGTEPQHPLLGKTIRVTRGRHIGSIGKIIKIAPRGWWTLDNAELNGQQVHSSRCVVVDPIIESEYKAYYDKLGTKMKRKPRIMLRKAKPGVSGGGGTKTKTADLGNNGYDAFDGEDNNDGGGVGHRTRMKLDRKMAAKRGLTTPSSHGATAIVPEEEEVEEGEDMSSSNRRVRPRRSSWNSSFSAVSSSSAFGKTSSPMHVDEDVTQPSSFSFGGRGERDGNSEMLRGAGTKQPLHRFLGHRLVSEEDYVGGQALHKRSATARSENKRRRSLEQTTAGTSVSTFPVENTIFGGNHSFGSMLSEEYGGDGVESLSSWERGGDRDATRFVPESSSSLSHSRFRQRRPHHVPTLPPVLLHAEDDSVVPQPVRHLPPDMKIDIFDRKTGRIMNGDDAVCVKDLPEVLRNHAEYEPVVPPPSSLGNEEASAVGNDAPSTSREGRSSAQSRVNADVVSQHKVRASAAEGRKVVVTGGPYKGLIGKVEACIPGGWYLIANLLENDELELDVVINSRDLEILPTADAVEHALVHGMGAGAPSSSRRNPGEIEPVAISQQDDDDLSAVRGALSHHFSVFIRSLKLRIASLIEERDKLLGALSTQDEGNHESDRETSTGGRSSCTVASLSSATMVEKSSTPEPETLPYDMTRNIVQHALDEIVLKLEVQERNRSNGSNNCVDTSHHSCPGQCSDENSTGQSKLNDSSGDLDILRLRRQLELVTKKIADCRRELDAHLSSISAIRDEIV